MERLTWPLRLQRRYWSPSFRILRRKVCWSEGYLASVSSNSVWERNKGLLLLRRDGLVPRPAVHQSHALDGFDRLAESVHVVARLEGALFARGERLGGFDRARLAHQAEVGDDEFAINADGVGDRVAVVGPVLEDDLHDGTEKGGASGEPLWSRSRGGMW